MIEYKNVTDAPYNLRKVRQNPMRISQKKNLEPSRD